MSLKDLDFNLIILYFQGDVVRALTIEQIQEENSTYASAASGSSGSTCFKKGLGCFGFC